MWFMVTFVSNVDNIFLFYSAIYYYPINVYMVIIKAR